MPNEWEEKVGITQDTIKKHLGPTKKPVEVVGQGINAGEDLKITNSNWQDTFRNFISAPLRGFTRFGGEAVGGTAGARLGPQGALAGAAGGGILADQLFTQTLGRISPRTFGGPSEDPFADLKSSALETGADLAFEKGLPFLRQTLKTKALQKFFPSNPNIPTNDAVSTLPLDFQPTVGQATGNRTAQWLENIVIPEVKRDTRVFQQQKALRIEADRLAQNITGGLYQVDKKRLAELSADKSKDLFKVIHKERKDLYDTAEAAINNEQVPGFRVEFKPASGLLDKSGKPIPGGPTLVSTAVIGPVYPNHTRNFATEVLKTIDEITGNPNNLAYQTPEAKASISALRNKVQSFTAGNLLTVDGKPVMQYATAKADKDELNSLLRTIPYEAKTRLAETIKALRNTISEDIKESSATWSDETRTALDRANEYHINTFKQIFGNKIGGMLSKSGKYANAEVIEEQLLDRAFASATLAEQFVKSAGTPKYLAGEYIKRFISEMQDTNGVMMGTRGVQYLENTAEVAKKFLSADQRKQLKNFARQVQVATWKEGEIPRTSIAFRGAYMALNLTAGVLTTKFTGSPLAGAIGLAVIPYLRGELSNMMLNPANARIAARLARLPAGSPESTTLMKQLFRTGLKGARFEVQTVTGESLGLFEAKSDGKIHPVDDNKIEMPENQKFKVTYE